MDKKMPNEKHTNPLTGSASFVSLKPLDLTNFTKEDIKAYFNNSYDIYETLFLSLRYDYVYYLCPDRLRLPLIFYYGHTAAVYMNKLCLAGLIKPNERINFECEMTFETGVDEMSWDDVEHYRMGGDYKWPTVEQTKLFRAKVRELINKVIDRTPLTLPVNWDNPWWAFFMGFEHERIHYETSTVLIRQYPIDMVQRPTCWAYGPMKLGKQQQRNEFISNPMIRVEEKSVRLGKSYDFPSYGWDNEYGRVDCTVSAFEASKYKVTNEQYLEFVLSNGYGTREYWSEEGWEWVQFKQAKHPLFWVCPMKCKSGCGGAIAAYSHCQEKLFSKDELEFFKLAYSDEENERSGARENARRKPVPVDSSNCACCTQDEENASQGAQKIPFKLRLMFDIVDMPRNWPVEVNYHEAKAYCKWKGDDFRLLTEAEHHAIRDREVLDLNTSSDIIYQKDAKVNHNLAFGSSTPVNMYPSNQQGFHDVFGNVWEWIEDNFNGLPGMRTHYLYDDFSTPCYDGRHNLIMGGSWASTGDECSHFARFMFRRHFYQHCGFRLARSTTDQTKKPNPQIRLVADRIFVLGNGFPTNKPDLDENKVVISYYPTSNDQYLYDSDKHPEYFEAELINQFDETASSWYKPLLSKTLELVKDLNINLDIATHLGCSMGRMVFDLSRLFHDVVGVDFCARFLDVAMRLQADGRFEATLTSDEKKKKNQVIRFDITDNMSAAKAIFKQMTWIPNEIPKSDLVIFSMIDRVTNRHSWIKRFKEIVKPHGVLIIYSQQQSKCNVDILKNDIGQIFDLIYETKLTGNDTFSAWRIKESYALENL